MTLADRVKRFQARKTDRSNCETMWEDVARYTIMVRDSFTTSVSNGAFLNDGSLFSNIGVTALRNFASAVFGACWRGAATSAKLVAPFIVDESELSSDMQSKFVKDSKMFAKLLDHPSTGFNLAFGQAMIEFANYGTGAVSVLETKTFPYAQVKAVPLKNLFLTHDPQEVFVCEELSGPAFAQRYPNVRLPEATAKKLTDDNAKIKVVLHIFPRPLDQRAEEGYLSKPFGSVEFLPEEKETGATNDGVLIDEAGYDYFPLMIMLNNKLPGELYGRGQGMDALPSLMEMNAARELFMLASEFKVEPVLWTYATSFNNGVFNKSPGALNVPNIASAQYAGGAPVAPVHTIGSVQELLALMESLALTIKEHFYIDKLFDLNSDARMTLGEAMIRKSLRDDAVSPFYLTIFAQGLNPALMALAMIYKSKNLILNGLDTAVLERAKAYGIEPYEIKFTSPAARGLRSADIKNYLDAFGLIGNAQQLFPEVADNFQADMFARRIPEMSGIDEDLLRTPADVLRLRDKRAKAAQAMQDAEQRALNAKANQSDAQAMQSLRQGQSGPFQDGAQMPF